MHETLKRALSGVVYVAIMWIGTSYSQASFHTLFLILGIVCLYEMWKLRKGKSIFKSYGIIPYLYVLTPFILVHFISPVQMLYLFILTWTFDTFAYLIGSTFGKHKILPSISPKKSWEGFFGGLLFMWISNFLILGFLLFIFVYGVSYMDSDNTASERDPLVDWLLIENVEIAFYWLPLIISITATAGDFIESSYKRQAGVKDSGNLIPGHGGILDRMDAFMISIPIFYLLINLYK